MCLFQTISIKIETIFCCSIFLPLSILTDSIVSSSHVIPCPALEVHPVVSILAAHGETVLIVHIVGLTLMPTLKAPGVTTSPLPGALSEIVHSSKPVAAGVVPINCLKPGLDQVVLRLAGGLGQEAVVIDTALLGLVPVDISIISASSGTQTTVCNLRISEDHVAFVGVVRSVDPSI